MRKKLFLSASLLLALISSQAQEVSYTHITFQAQHPAIIPQYAGYKSFDITVLSPIDNTGKAVANYDLPYQVKLGNLTQVDGVGDFHVVALASRYNGKLASASNAVVAITLGISVYDKFGTNIKNLDLNTDQYPVDFGRELSKDERQNQDVLRRLILEKILQESLKPLLDDVNGGLKKETTTIAYLDKVKKKPELQDFEKQFDVLRPALEKEGLAGFKNTATPYTDYWSKMTEYTGENADEVKRAAFQNLALYNIAAGDYDKAAALITQYKAIDKQIKESFGLIKYYNSQDLETLMSALKPGAGQTFEQENKTEQTKAQIVDNYRYAVVNGTATISDKRNAGTYNGIIKINKLPTASNGNIASLDPATILVEVNATDDKGQAKTFTTTIDKVDALKDNSGATYIGQKFGSAILGGSSYVFMKSTYTSAKITVYRTLLPAGGKDYVVKKAGDDKGIKSSMFNAKKTLIDYLADCPSLTDKLKNNTLTKEEGTIEKVAEAYSACQ